MATTATAPEWTADFTDEQIETFLEGTLAHYEQVCANRDRELAHLGTDASLWTTRDRDEIARWASFVDSIIRDYRDLQTAHAARAAALAAA